jgi:ATP-dependent protease Clp ATPase subunit
MYGEKQRDVLSLLNCSPYGAEHISHRLAYILTPVESKKEKSAFLVWQKSLKKRVSVISLYAHYERIYNGISHNENICPLLSLGKKIFFSLSCWSKA